MICFPDVPLSVFTPRSSRTRIRASEAKIFRHKLKLEKIGQLLSLAQSDFIIYPMLLFATTSFSPPVFCGLFMPWEDGESEKNACEERRERGSEEWAEVAFTVEKHFKVGYTFLRSAVRYLINFAFVSLSRWKSVRIFCTWVFSFLDLKPELEFKLIAREFV